MKAFFIGSLFVSVLLVGSSLALTAESQIIINYIDYVESLLRIRFDNDLKEVQKLADKIYEVTPGSIQSNLRPMLIAFLSQDIPTALSSPDNLKLKDATLMKLKTITDEVGVLARYQPQMKVVEVAQQEVEKLLPKVYEEDQWFLGKVSTATGILRSKLTPEQADAHSDLLDFFSNGVPQPFYEAYEAAKTKSYVEVGL